MVLKFRRRLHIVASRTHKWLALVIGIQLLLWFASGALMSFLPIEDVRGEHLVDREHARPIALGPNHDLANLVAGHDSVTIRMRGDRVVAETPSAIFDAATGEPMPPLGAAEAVAIARAAWREGTPPEASAHRVKTASTEYRGPLPAWRIDFGDPDGTRAYVTEAGRIAAVRTDTWRLYDFFWSLHIMDWKTHEDFNTPWLLAFALGGLLLAIAGTVLLAMRWPRRRRR